MDDSSYEDQLPDDLKSVADALRSHRDVPDGSLLDRVFHRVRPSDPQPRRPRLLTPRTAAMVVLLLAVLVGARLSHLRPGEVAATLAGTVTNSVSTSPSGSAADDTYCPEGPGGWAPTFRAHYGQPTPDTGGFDDSFSPSVQPNCTDGSLKITWTDGITVSAGVQLWAGYDFHRSAQQLYSVTVSPAKVVLNLKCGNGSQTTFTESLPTGYYQNPPQNYWTPDGNNNHAQSAFQSGPFYLPAVCGTGNPVMVTGGTFYATVVAR